LTIKYHLKVIFIFFFLFFVWIRCCPLLCVCYTTSTVQHRSCSVCMSLSVRLGHHNLTAGRLLGRTTGTEVKKSFVYLLYFTNQTRMWLYQKGTWKWGKSGNSIKCLSQGHSFTLPHQESNQILQPTTFRLGLYTLLLSQPSINSELRHTAAF